MEMNEDDWAIVLEVFNMVQSRRDEERRHHSNLSVAISMECEHNILLASTVANIVSRPFATLLANPSRDSIRLRARAPMIASRYT